MSQKLTLASLNGEPKNDAQRMMFGGFALMIATALGCALVAALTIAKGTFAGGDRAEYLVRIPYWCVSVLAVCMVYLKLHIYGRFISHTLTVYDILIPLTKAFIGSALFGVLSFDDPRMWHLWPLVFAMFALISHLKIRYYMGRFDEEKATPEIADLIRMIREHTKKGDLRATRFFAAAFLVVWVLLNFVPPLQFMAHWSPKWQALLALPAGFGMVAAIHSDNPIRAAMEKLAEQTDNELPRARSFTWVE
jgi:hypothetical protein